MKEQKPQSQAEPIPFEKFKAFAGKLVKVPKTVLDKREAKYTGANPSVW